jgi:1-aminocyclopropane-1-carboxylate deaminase/D-cysteine desulfhydrase-like pyridoxal-dependent ACC family enzyme
MCLILHYHSLVLSSTLHTFVRIFPPFRPGFTAQFDMMYQGDSLIISYIPAGASDHPLGGLGFANLMLEIAEQESSMGVFFDTLMICSVTGSSHAGCVVGAVAEGRKRKIIGIDASAKPAATRAQVLRIARNTAKMLDEGLEIRDDDVILDERFHAGVYGIPDDGTIEAMKCESTAGRLDGYLVSRAIRPGRKTDRSGRFD